MAISETKMQIVIANYFKDECDVNTSIRQAFEKGFRIGVKKGANTNRPQGEWIVRFPYKDTGKTRTCSNCNITQIVNVYDGVVKFKFCPYCGAMMKGPDDETISRRNTKLEW